jgi:hypothetical protein
MELISPELALVDPELARLGRASLPPPRDCLASAIAALSAPRRSELPRPSLTVALVALVLATLVGTPSASAGRPGHRSPLRPSSALGRATSPAGVQAELGSRLAFG